MGRRSRKRSVTPGERSALPTQRAPVSPPRRPPAAVRHRAPAAERPPAPWGDFPLGELTTLAGLVLVIVGFVRSAPPLLAVGFALVALSATELAAREHFAGFRSHSTLLGLILGVVTAVVLVAAGVPRPLQIGLAAVAFVAGFVLLRRAFQRRTGGLGFRA